MNHAPIVPIVLPALVAALMLLDRRIASQRGLAWLSCGLLAGCASWMTVRAADGWTAVYLVGNWAAPWGIALVADRLSAMMVLLVAVLSLVALGAAHRGFDERGEHFHPLFQVQLMGLNGAFLTGDLFNLFVFFEVLLIASYGLLVHGDGATRVVAGLRFVTLNLFGSALFLIATATLYGTTGTLNLADLSLRVAGLDATGAALARGAAWLLLAVFCLKAAILPLYFWLPGTYAAAGAPVAALFAVMTKVGLYAVLRVHTLVFGAQAGPVADAAFPWIVALAAAGHLSAMLGAVAGDTLRRTAAMLVVASAGFLLVGIGLATERSIAAAIYYLPHTTLAAAALFLVAELAARGRGALEDRLVPGAAPARPALVGLLYVAAAAAIAGLPPFGGFVGKAMLLDAMLPPDAAPTARIATLWAAVLGGGLLATIALARAGSTLFWKSAAPAGPIREPAPVEPGGASAWPAIVSLVAVAAIALAAAPLQRYAAAAARDLLQPSALVGEVLGTVPKPGPHQPDPPTFR